ncbi:hypothetical protein [Salinisphaera sp.]|uniref:hypothetical protein n=1 Tax=Salinisphaera sp. TaxID=1914330 RepID=UPI002D778573|nr:hypothetical protein [Salinisphaera sp.]HET7314436.1 hypothetical protein [Salinisphaera sp.]
MDGFNKHKILQIILICDGMLVALFLLTNYLAPIPSWTITHWFDMDSEKNIPTWFSTVQLFFIASLCATYWRGLEERHLRRFYLLAALAFAFLSMDEAAQLHEGIARLARKVGAMYADPTPGLELWMVIYPAVAIAGAALFWREVAAFLRDKRGNAILFGGVIIYLGGVIGFEALAVMFIPTGTHNWLSGTEVALEEGSELLGQSLMVYAMLNKLKPTRVAERAEQALGLGVTRPQT